MKTIKLLALTAIISLASCVTNGNQNTSNTTDSTGVSLSSNGQIAVVKMDSLMSFYGLAMDRIAEFNKKQDKAQKELEKRAKSLEWQVKDFHTKAQNGQVTTYQGQKTQEKLQKQEQSLMAFREKTMRELTEEETVITNEISGAIMSYIQEFNAQKRYSMILQTMGANPVLICDPAIDITAEVLAGLNAQYEKTL